ncbi:hypothetical protein [Pontixanthobacter gangjinensis]|uniref:Lipoprotein n=1 Tax=Pontixanthobacter gangjinensis TaxID=1028742 RepID=A0A6I4SPF3_9SPHN|nr:hypothetical protein [Pontixanthobacter gangjinensis]MXO57644.1 hypothetical protein [Pontixanthobacter gangjinensis]
MKRILAALFIGLAAAMPAACVDNVYGRGTLAWSSHPYHGWYNGYYGPFYDGYWGTDGYFWFRLDRVERRYRRDRDRHFRREAVRNDRRFRRFERTMRPPPRGTRMPHFPQDRPPGHSD